MGFYLKQARNN